MFAVGERSLAFLASAKQVDQYIHRILVEEDANSQRSSDELYHASSEAGKELYNKGDFAKSPMKNIEAYLLKKVGMFPDVLERKVTRHFDEGDKVGFSQFVLLFPFLFLSYCLSMASM